MWSVSLLFLFIYNERTLAVTEQVKTDAGTFIGLRRDVVFKGVTRTYKEFRGIPYGEAPTGELRFKKPVPKRPLQTPFDATFRRPYCPQLIYKYAHIPDFEYDEDCLRLDIYVPYRNEQTFRDGMSVMIWIHGGAFQLGGSNLYVSDTLSTFGDVIVVNINYRLSIFGFLSTGDEESPGNYGLWDQHLAIKWVHNHIEAFGGDPGSVTLFGLSAGGVSVFHQALYPGNKGLFQRIIPESGAPANHWAFNKSPNPDKLALRIGCTGTTKEMVRCLREKTVDEIFNALNYPTVTWLEYGFTCVKDGTFITEDPDILIEKMSTTSEEFEHYLNLNLLTGVGDMEGGYHMLTLWPSILGILDLESYMITHEAFQTVVIPEVLRHLNKADGMSDSISSKLAKAIQFRYTDWTDPKNTSKIREMLLQLSSDYAFVADVVTAADVHSKFSKHGRTYFYQFAARPSSMVTFKQLPSWMKGVTHAEDMVFRFGFSKRYLTTRNAYFLPLQEELDTAEVVMTMWTNFAKTGNPNEPRPIPTRWLEYTETGREYLDIAMFNVSMKRRFSEPWTSFWLELVPYLSDEDTRETEVHHHTEL